MLVWYPTDTAGKSEWLIIIIIVSFVVVFTVVFLLLFLQGHVQKWVKFQQIRNVEFLSLVEYVRYILAFLFQT